MLKRKTVSQCPTSEYCRGWNDALDAMDAEPVRHGKNVTYTHPSDMFVCSECGFSCEIIELRYDDNGMDEPDSYEYDCNYCPNCGVKMDLEEEE